MTNWKECLNNNAAWDTLTWFAALIAMAAALNKYGFIPWLSTSVVNIVGGLGLGWQVRQCGRVAAGRWRGKQDTGLQAGASRACGVDRAGLAVKKSHTVRLPSALLFTHPPAIPSPALSLPTTSQGAFGIVVLLYFYSHYFFASGAAHIGAMYTAFLAVATACGTPPMLAAIALGQLSNLMGCLTTYGIGSAPPYFGAGYVPQVRVARAGREAVGGGRLR